MRKVYKRLILNKNHWIIKINNINTNQILMLRECRLKMCFSTHALKYIPNIPDEQQKKIVAIKECNGQ